MQQRKKDILVIGFALFAMFLGAANIIFPPYLGAIAGKYWWLAFFGFILTGMSLPVLGVVATSKAGGSADAISNKVSPRFATILNSLLMVFIGPLFAMPRTAATTVELSLIPFLPQSIDPQIVLLTGGFVFFSISYLFARNPGRVVDRIGTILTPLLVLFLLSLILYSIIQPVGKPATSTVPHAFHTGFVTGYQTMDAIAAIIFGGTVMSTLRAKGYSLAESKKMIWPIALICGLGIVVVYGGFTWIGASGSSKLQQLYEKTALTVEVTRLLAGSTGQILLALIVFLACCTTAIGLTATATHYFLPFFKGKLSYKGLVLLLTLLSYGMSIQGVEGIIVIASPILELVYPVVIVLVVLNLLGERIRYNYVYIGALLGALPAAILNVMRLYLFSRPVADAWLVHFPFGDAGFGCFIPAMLGALIGDWLAKSRELQGRLPESARLRYPEEEDLVERERSSL